ncbi:MAG: hypothetical protein IT343_08890 [Candidatus Melainabacteria bacterium]|jgi:hypothetical protein|nr:hypothetical protein [Candidatus Melainabacteria bacterium]
MMFASRVKGKVLLLASVCAFWLGLSIPADAAIPPVRMSITPGGQSGIEQEVCDRLNMGLSNSQDVVISTVNPDWFVVCTITEKTDQNTGQIRYNGTVTVKTRDGQVITTSSVQKYNQDYVVPGQQLNKRLVDNAARDVIQAVSDRSMPPIQQAVEIEIETRKKIIEAEMKADEDKYDEASAILRPIGPESPRFRAVRDLMDEYAMEKEAMSFINTAKAKARAGAYGQAVIVLKQVNKHSKRYRNAMALMAQYRGRK